MAIFIGKIDAQTAVDFLSFKEHPFGAGQVLPFKHTFSKSIQLPHLTWVVKNICWCVSNFFK